jgi:hypothetical protein
MNDKIIEIARFAHANEAEMLASLLRAEEIDCFVRDGISSRIMFGNVDIGGAKVDLLFKDAPKAVEIMKEHGYEISESVLEDIDALQFEDEVTEYKEHKAKFAQRMKFILILIIAILVALFVLKNYFNG